MFENENYRPKFIEFDVAHDGSLMPESFGTYENEKELVDFLRNLLVVNHGVTVNRYLDAKEKQTMRITVSEILETKLPNLRREHAEALSKLQEAKENEKRKSEHIHVTLQEVEELSNVIRRGLKEISLDEKYTYKIAYRGKLYFYTWIDKEFKLVKIREMQEKERSDLFNQMHNNEKFIDDNFDNVSSIITDVDFEDENTDVASESNTVIEENTDNT